MRREPRGRVKGGVCQEKEKGNPPFFVKKKVGEVMINYSNGEGGGQLEKF